MAKKDKLDKALEELSGFKPKDDEVIERRELDEMGIPTEELTNFREPIDDYKAIMYKNTFAVKDTYLPNVLVKLGLFIGNADARKHIREQGVILNGKLTNDVEATTQSSNFSIRMTAPFDNTIEYQVFRVEDY